MRLSIERMSYGPDAIAHGDDGKVVFVTGAVPGDEVEASVTQTGRSFSRAVVSEVLAPSPSRVESRCPYAGICGGCPWVAISYDEQLDLKRGSVVDSLRRIGHMDEETVQTLVSPCVRVGDEWGYRNKVELAFARSGNKAILGMHGAADKDVIRVDRCLLLEKSQAKSVKAVSGALTYLANSHGLEFERVGIRCSSRTGDMEVALWTQTGGFPRAQAAKVIGDAVKASSIVRVLTKGPSKARKVAGVECLSGNGFWSERVEGGVMRLSAPSFFQVNTPGAEKLVELALDGLDVKPDDVAMDLYCGAGTFTIPLAKRCSFVSAVESYGPAVRDLRRNVESAGLDNVDAVGGDAGREFPDDLADVIVVDPPRAGLEEGVIDQLCAQPARAIAYVSCDPATLARDLARFSERGVFAPTSVTPVDLFPETFHVETVTILSRTDG